MGSDFTNVFLIILYIVGTHHIPGNKPGLSLLRNVFGKYFTNPFRLLISL